MTHRTLLEMMRSIYPEPLSVFFWSTLYKNYEPRFMLVEDKIRKVKIKLQKNKMNTITHEKHAKKEMKNNYRIYIEETTENVKKDSTLFWKYSKEQIAQSNKKILTHNGKELSDAKIIADTFAHHFLNTHNHEQPNLESNSDHIVSDGHIHIEHFTQKEIAQAILSREKATRSKVQRVNNCTTEVGINNCTTEVGINCTTEVGINCTTEVGIKGSNNSFDEFIHSIM
ncbi:hypothetical protein M8J77_024113 [Diaphorina citri]|nr:hypothetical protein M8J77_024113 [Diaphorina citri]